LQPGQQPPQASSWSWIRPVVAFGVMALAALLFFQTRDPMILVFGLFGAIFVSALFRPYRWYGWGHPWWGPGWYGPMQPPQQVVKVKCASCSALNDEHARYCQQCGKPM